MKQIAYGLIFSLLFLGASIPGYAIAESVDCYIIEENSKFQNLPHPAVAVALGGGGARALVNIGVLKALEEEQIPIDMVVGTSMGALVAVMYGSGLPVEQLEELVTTLDLPQLFTLNFPFVKSLLNTVELNHFIEATLRYKHLEQFPIPTALLSYDLNSGTKYVHTSGRVATAIQGPYAIPLFFPGQTIGDYFLIDAGIHELTPAQTARVLGADIVIATTAFDELPYTDYTNGVRSFTRLINLIKEDYSLQNVYRYSDVVIDHDVGAYSFMDFQLAQNFIDLGYRETMAKMSQIKELLVEKNIPLRAPAQQYPVAMEQVISDVRYDRGILDYVMLQPQIYLGTEQSGFKQELFRNADWHLQYGATMKTGRLRAGVLAKGQEELEAQLRVVKVRDSLDLMGKLRWDGTAPLDWEWGIQGYRRQSNYVLGLAELSGDRYFHLKGAYQTRKFPWSWQNETDLYLPADHNKQLEYIVANSWSIPLRQRWSLNPGLVLSSSFLDLTPEIYRGRRAQSSRIQTKLDLVHDYDFTYTIEVAQIFQVEGIRSYFFGDWQRDVTSSYALGLGTGVDFSLLGLKPSYLGIYGAYDLTWQEAVYGIKCNLYL